MLERIKKYRVAAAAWVRKRWVAIVAWRSEMIELDRSQRDEVERVVRQLGLATLSRVRCMLQAKTPGITESEVYRHLLTLENQGRIYPVVVVTTHRGRSTEFQGWTPS